MDTVSPLRVAVVGCGTIAYEHLAYMATSPLATLVGVCDTSPAAAEFAAKRFNCDNWFTSVDDMLNKANVDVLHVLVPPHIHESVVRSGLTAGCHILCEKPLAPTKKDLQDRIDEAKKTTYRLMESQNFLFNDPIIDLKKSIRSGQLGDVREIDILLSLDLVKSRFGDLNLTGPGVVLPGGAVHDLLPHMSYVFLHLADQPVNAVTGRLWNASGNPRVGFDQLDCLVFANNVRGRPRCASDLKPDYFRVTVRGTKGSVETEMYSPYRRFEGGKNVGKRVAVERVASGLGMALAGFTSTLDKVRQHGAYHGIPRMIDAYYQSIIDDTPQPISHESMLSSATLIDQIVALGVSS
jgi:predicted dehydrogenase